MKLLLENGQQVTIKDENEIARGGEGRILSIPELPDKVIKLFLLPDKTITRLQKDALNVLDQHFFVRPDQLAYAPSGGIPTPNAGGWAAGNANTNKQGIVGYTMQWLPQNFIPLATIFNKPYCTKYRLNNAFRLKVLENIKTAMLHAHAQNIVIGDLSGLNTMLNPDGDVKFIDVDSYQTSAQVHSHCLLDDIRDYLYQGRVSMNSDFFAFSVLAFNMLTFTHPFKGVHKTYQSLAERMIHKIPVFKPDPQLIVPKVYEPITEPVLMKQFEDYYLEGQRYCLSTDLSKLPDAVQTPTPQPPITSTQELSVKSFLDLAKNEEIIDAQFVGNTGFISTTSRHLWYNTAHNGSVMIKASVPSNGQEYCFLGQENFLKKHNDKLLILESGQNFVEIENFSFKPESRFLPYGSIMAVVEDNFLKFLKLDQVIQKQIAITQTPVHGKGFRLREGLMQNVGGKQYIFYNSGQNLTTVPLTELTHDLKQVANHGILAIRENLPNQEVRLKHLFFSIQDLKVHISKESTSSLKTFGYRANDARHGLIFEAIDDALHIRRTQDFAVIQSLKCEVLTEQSLIFSTPAGIIAVNAEGAYLLNKK
ncbi:MAG: hypothetical protein EAZ57_07055 [Cytophagales bacterium]|nr:MAG: hypothetical protein EAZ67_07865 [Cytophagales bacterium]TAF60460.1 MAG: hypothetical protein EAZ57_07055 [Cytophagales bacterium]